MFLPVFVFKISFIISEIKFWWLVPCLYFCRIRCDLIIFLMASYRMWKPKIQEIIFVFFLFQLIIKLVIKFYDWLFITVIIIDDKFSFLIFILFNIIIFFLATFISKLLKFLLFHQFFILLILLQDIH